MEYINLLKIKKNFSIFIIKKLLIIPFIKYNKIVVLRNLRNFTFQIFLIIQLSERERERVLSKTLKFFSFRYLLRSFTNCKQHLSSSFVVMLTWHFGFLMLVLLIVMIVFGNLVVLLAVLIDRDLKRLATNKFIASLAISDLLVGIVVMPLSLYATVGIITKIEINKN